jgi:hypothetical protein
VASLTGNKELAAIAQALDVTLAAMDIESELMVKFRLPPKASALRQRYLQSEGEGRFAGTTP